MIYSENAPELEAKLHERFWERRLNWSNDRKEFFNASVDEVAVALEQLGLKTDVLRVPEAREFRETVAEIEQGSREKATASAPITGPRFPADPFAAA